MDKVLVTGASRGIGAATAIRFAQQGSTHLTITYRRQREDALHVADLCRHHGAQVFLRQLDLREHEDSQAQIKSSIEEMGGLDVLVNNAGVTADALALRMNEDRWDQVLDTNLKTPFFITKIALKTMIKQRHGRVINLSSVIAQRSRGGQVNYASSKGAIEAMTRSLALEVASRGITVNAVAPGWIETDMTKVVDQQSKGSGGIESTIPLGRTGRPEDVAALICFLASKEAEYITGQVISIDGGLSVRL